MRYWKKSFIRCRKSKLKGEEIWVEVEAVPAVEAAVEAAVAVQVAAEAAADAAPEAARLAAAEAVAVVHHVVLVVVHHAAPAAHLADLAVAAIQGEADR